MAINALGWAQGLGAAAQGLQSGYMGAIGSVYSRRLAQQKQDSESALQSSQGDYYSGRNQASLGAAQARADAMSKVATIKAGTAQAAMRDKALTALPGNLANMYYQSPEVVDAFTKSYDAQNGTSLNASLFPGASPQGGPLLPLGGSIGAPPVGGANGNGSGFGGGLSPSLPPFSPASLPPAGPVGAPLPSPQTGPVGNGSGFGGGLSQFLGGGLPPSLPPQSGSVPPQSGGLPQSGLLPSGPIGDAPVMTNPLHAPPLVAAKASLLNGQLSYLNGPKTAQSAAQAQKDLAGAGLAVSQGRFYDARTKEVVPEAKALMRLQAAQAGAANANASTLPAFRQGLVANGQTVAGAGLLNAKTNALTKPIEANAAAMNAGANVLRTKSGGGGAGGGVAGDALAAKMNQRLTALTMPGRPDMYGKPTPPLVTLDANGNPSGTGAHEYHQIQALLRGRQNGAEVPPGGLAPMPISAVGRLVPQGTPIPYAPRRPGRKGGGLNLQNFMP